MSVQRLSIKKCADADDRNLRTYLRHETQDIHVKIDAYFAPETLETEAGYRAFICGNFLGWSQFRELWSGFAKTELRIAPPDYAALLADDLTEIAEGALSRLPRLPQSHLPCQAGAVYVLAGSRLGMASINRRLNWGAAHNKGTRFIREPSGPLIFRALMNRLDLHASHAIDRELAVMSAWRVFAVFRDAMEFALAEAAPQ